jgi:hypothetical protein
MGGLGAWPGHGSAAGPGLTGGPHGCPQPPEVLTAQGQLVAELILQVTAGVCALPGGSRNPWSPVKSN